MSPLIQEVAPIWSPIIKYHTKNYKVSYKVLVFSFPLASHALRVCELDNYLNLTTGPFLRTTVKKGDLYVTAKGKCSAVIYTGQASCHSRDQLPQCIGKIAFSLSAFFPRWGTISCWMECFVFLTDDLPQSRPVSLCHDFQFRSKVVVLLVFDEISVKGAVYRLCTFRALINVRK